MEADVPVVITGAVDDWPALEKWRDLGYRLCSMHAPFGTSWLLLKAIFRVCCRKLTFPCANFVAVKRVAGARTVPVEVGADYTREHWAQNLMRISDFIDM